jgi:hypothetical protein
MKQSKVLLHGGLFCLAVALGWYSRGAFDTSRRTGAGSPGDTPAKLAAAGPDGSRATLERAENQWSSSSAQPSGGELQAGSSAASEWPESTPVPEPPQLSAEPSMTATGVPGHDVELSADRMTLQSVRPRPGSAQSRLPPMPALPPDIRAEDVEVSAETGVVRILRREPGPAPARPLTPPAEVPPNSGDRVIVSGPGAMLIQQQPPDRKPPSSAPTAKPPKE